MSRSGSILICQNCGELLQKNWDKCPVCLTPTSSVSLTCPNCLAAIKENWKICPDCKTTLPGWETPPAHGKGKAHKCANQNNNRIFVTMVDNKPMAAAGFTFDLPITKGDVLGDRYSIIQHLGAGGFGAVYQVEDLVLNEQIALKVVVAGEGKAKNATEQILHEFRLREKINDITHIVKAQDPRPSEYKGLSLVLLPMELADGRSMRQWLFQNQDIEKRQKQGFELFRQACIGVKAIHGSGLVHLDIKPENILLVNGKAKIADFGIGRYGACQFSKNPDQLLHQGIGTPQYMSPEQFQVARQKDIGPASDIYSLGIVLFEILDGNLPFDGTPIELRDKHLNMLPPQLPEKLDRWRGIVQRCLEKKVEDRYDNIKQLIKDLDGIIQGTALSTDVSCPQCGHINANSAARECTRCRTNLTSLFRLCPVCDKSLRLDIEICPVCGKAVAAYYLLLHRKECIEKLKDEDPVEAIELLETVLQQETEDYHERAIQLLKGLRKKQLQINPLTIQARKAESECLPEKAVEIWHEILRIIPRHRIALEQIQKLESLIKDFQRRMEKATVLMDEANFENAGKLLQSCLALIPTRKDVKEILEACRSRSQKYRNAFSNASTTIKNELMQQANEQIQIALSQAPESIEAQSLSEQIRKTWADSLLREALAKINAGKKEKAESLLKQAEQLWPKIEGLYEARKMLEDNRPTPSDKFVFGKKTIYFAIGFVIILTGIVFFEIVPYFGDNPRKQGNIIKVPKVTQKPLQTENKDPKKSPYQDSRLTETAKKLQNSADAGDANAMLSLGKLYEFGDGVTQNTPKALELYSKAAEAGNTTAMNYIGRIYLEGRGVVKNIQKSFEWYHKAAKAGNPFAMIHLGWTYEQGQDVSRDYQKAIEWYRKAAEAGESIAMHTLGVTYKNGRGVSIDYQKALEWFTKAAEAGESAAMSELGIMYWNGQGVDKNPSKAVEWFRKSADAGNSTMMDDLGRIYEEGAEGVPKDYTEAIKWYRKAAEAGNKDAMTRLGSIYCNGKSVIKDYQKAFEWYNKAASAGEDGAMLVLGLMYRNGEGIAIDYQKAMEWFSKSAGSGNSLAMYCLGCMYQQGQGINSNYHKALEWYHKSAEVGNTLAIMHLAAMYEQGEGVAKDYQKAVEWYRKAAKLGSINAQEKLDKLGQK